MPTNTPGNDKLGGSVVGTQLLGLPLPGQDSLYYLFYPDGWSGYGNVSSGGYCAKGYVYRYY